MNWQLRDIADVWPAIESVFSVPHGEDDYRRLVALLDAVVDEVGNDESHPLASLMETLGSLVENYESRTLPAPEGRPIDALKELMEERGIYQSGLPEIGSQGVVSEILAGKRELNLRQVKLLSKRFNVSPAVFVKKYSFDRIYTIYRIFITKGFRCLSCYPVDPVNPVEKYPSQLFCQIPSIFDPAIQRPG
jgi:HTH-type transcriptional regulator/antitoxin HigA